MDTFIHQLMAGVASGGIYASIGLALVMIFQATHHINFAQGEQAMFSAYIALVLIQAGVPANRVSAAPLTVATVWDSGPPKKTDAKLEIVASAPAPATDAKK